MAKKKSTRMFTREQRATAQKERRARVTAMTPEEQLKHGDEYMILGAGYDDAVLTVTARCAEAWLHLHEDRSARDNNDELVMRALARQFRRLTGYSIDEDIANYIVFEEPDERRAYDELGEEI